MLREKSLAKPNREARRDQEAFAYGNMKDGVLSLEDDDGEKVKKLEAANQLVERAKKDLSELLQRQLDGEQGLEQKIIMAKGNLELEESRRAGELSH